MKFMKQSIFLFSLMVLCVKLINAQVKNDIRYYSLNSVINFNQAKEGFNTQLLFTEAPKPASEKMVIYNYPQSQNTNQIKKTSGLLPNLSCGISFFGNTWGGSTPNDNDMAISNDGYLVSVVNTNIYMVHTNSLSNSVSKSLSAFTGTLIANHREFDPKILYDPEADRFIFMCLNGNTSATNSLVFGFSQTNNPTSNWNMYILPGNPLNNNLWSDYPMLALTKKDVFLTVNLLYNDSSWQTGFVETLIWQIGKKQGFAGAPLKTKLHSNIRYEGKSIRNLCPAKGGDKLYGPNMFYVSNRNFASQNDSIFIVETTDTIGGANNSINVKVSKSNQLYYFPLGASQPIASQTLATNDARVLSAFFLNNKIQFVNNSKAATNSLSTVYYGVIDNPSSASPITKGYLIENDTVEFGYPNISYAGLNANDFTALINFNHSNKSIFAGLSAVKADGQGNFSKVFRIKNGTTAVNLLTANLERWGDYSGSQTKYNNPGEVWVSGYNSYRHSISYPNAHGTWIAQIGINDSKVTMSNNDTQKALTPQLAVYPNPIEDMVSVSFELDKADELTFKLYDINGKLLNILLQTVVRPPYNTVQINLNTLSSGVYFLKISGTKTKEISKKIIKN